MRWNPALGRNGALGETAFAHVAGRAFWWLRREGAEVLRATAPPGEWKGGDSLAPVVRGDSPGDSPAAPRPWPRGRESHQGGREGRRGTPQPLLRRLRLLQLSLPLPAPNPSSQIGGRAGDRGRGVPAASPAQLEQQRPLPGTSRRRDRPDAGGRGRRRETEHTRDPFARSESQIPRAWYHHRRPRSSSYDRSKASAPGLLRQVALALAAQVPLTSAP
ncbi:uncharacterized protein LOC111540421 [Piliocolobus tephrosceles]|uniref:uncharacterized protein LOC111540421 n=1 Tax=Piliocolobus tephrosceles TaxID=591936 RepID=UPI000C296678|nr:uncharacterized protein LOC111540421 [Piliocolobus tephrosceles]